MSLATKRKIILYGTPLITACIRIKWTLPGLHDVRLVVETDPTYLYVTEILGWCVSLATLWFLYWFIILMTAFVVSEFSVRLGWTHGDSERGLSDEIRGVVTLTWLMMTLGGWLIQYWPSHSDGD